MKTCDHLAWKAALALAAGDSKLASRVVECSQRAVLTRLVCKTLGITEAEFWRQVAKDIEAPR